MGTGSLIEQLTAGFAAAVSDIREKLVEEAWFGRATAPTEAPLPELCPIAPAVEQKLPTTYDELRAFMAAGNGYERETARGPEHSPGHDIER